MAGVRLVKEALSETCRRNPCPTLRSKKPLIYDSVRLLVVANDQDPSGCPQLKIGGKTHRLGEAMISDSRAEDAE